MEAVEVVSERKLNDDGVEQREVPVERGNEDKGKEREEDEEDGLSASQVVVKMKSTKQKGS